MAYKLSKTSRNNMAGVSISLQEITNLAIKITPIDFGIPKLGGRRSAEEQYRLYSDGKSNCDGYEKLSKHQSGKAIDFYAFVNGRASWDPDHLAIVACAFLQAANTLGYRVRWGGFFKPYKRRFGKDYKSGWDFPHIEEIA